MYKFKGKDGEFVTGVPAVDISDDDYKSLTDEQKDILKAHMKTDKPLYEKVDESKDEKAKDDEAPKKASGSVDAKQAAR